MITKFDSQSISFYKLLFGYDHYFFSNVQYDVVFTHIHLCGNQNPCQVITAIFKQQSWKIMAVVYFSHYESTDLMGHLVRAHFGA